MSFFIKYKTLHIGTLDYIDGHWEFSYSDEFCAQSDVHRLVDFPSVKKKYRSQTLFPFFQCRIPSGHRPDIRCILDAEGIDEQDIIRMLRRFGTMVITDPFILEYNEK